MAEGATAELEKVTEDIGSFKFPKSGVEIENNSYNPEPSPKSVEESDIKDLEAIGDAISSRLVRPNQVDPKAKNDQQPMESPCCPQAGDSIPIMDIGSPTHGERPRTDKPITTFDDDVTKTCGFSSQSSCNLRIMMQKKN